MNEAHISAFLLERYHLGEVTPEEQLRIENALAKDASLAAALEDLNLADRDFWRRFPNKKFSTTKSIRSLRLQRLRRVHPAVWGLCAAAVLLVIALPFFILKNFDHESLGDRMKGVSAGGNSIDLSVYLRGNHAGEEIKLPDQAGISAGNTVQLAYCVQTEDSGEKFGVIFSIDGRASVTLHYPYGVRQSTRLVLGKPVSLDEAYTLDDAPNYEIFFFVAVDEPLEVENILNTARRLALQIMENPQETFRYGTAAFGDYELKILTLWKEQ